MRFALLTSAGRSSHPLGVRSAQRPSTSSFVKTHGDPAYRRAVLALRGVACFFVRLAAVYYFALTLHLTCLVSGDEGIRTPGLRRAKAALSQLSYIPELFGFQVGLSGLEPETSPLSEARSNQLS